MGLWKNILSATKTLRARAEPVARKSVRAADRSVARSIPVAPASNELREAFALVLLFEAAKDANFAEVRAVFADNPQLTLGPKSFPAATPLHAAVEKPNRQIVELLLEKGADVNARTKMGDTPLHLAARHASDDVTAALLSHGADVNARNKAGATPLLLAAGKGNAEVADLLIANGADVNAKDNNGAMALHYIAEESSSRRFFHYRPVMEMLIANHADVDAVDSYGQTALHLAASRGLTDMAIVLLNNHASVNPLASAGTPLSFAQLADDKPMIQLLEAHGGCVPLPEFRD